METSLRMGLILLALLLLAPAGLRAQPGALVTPLAGQVECQRPGESAYRALLEAGQLPPETYVRTGPDGLASLRYADGTEVDAKPNTVLQVKGQEQQGVWVWVGSVMVRARRLLDSEAQLQVRTPIAVAAVRGTEFGVSVDPSSRTRVYVFDGLVGVANTHFPDREVLVHQGEMTVVEPLRPPSPPSPFQSGEFDRMGRLDLLERAEDPVLEASEDPAVESYLAFADPDIDALRNPAYLAQSRGWRSTSLLSASGSVSREWLDNQGTRRDITHFAGDRILGQHVTLAPVEGPWRAGLAVQGARSHDEATATVRPPLSLAAQLQQQVGDQRWGEVQGMGARFAAGMAMGIGGGYRRSHLEAESTPLDSTAPAELTKTDGRLVSLETGAVLGTGSRRSLGLSWTHHDLESKSQAGLLNKDLRGWNEVGEALYRQRLEAARLAGLLRVEVVRTSEDVAEGNAAVYHEHRKVWSAKGGGGLGLEPAQGVLVGLDLVGGVSSEKAIQYLPAGGIREDEDDWRVLASFHLGTQVRLTRKLVLTLDLLHQVARIREDFLLLPGTPDEARQQQLSNLYTSSVLSGLGYVWQGMVLEYFLASSQHLGGPFSHNLLLVVER